MTRRQSGIRIWRTYAQFRSRSLLCADQQDSSEGKVRDGLVGGYLPILRFVYPESEGNWTEMIAFAPFANLQR